MISENGTGKSTIFYLISGNYRPNRGKIHLNGNDPVWHHGKAMDGTSIIPEKPVYFGSSRVNEFIKWFSNIQGINKNEIYNYLTLFDLDHIKFENIKSLSMGEAQLLYNSCYMSGNFKNYIFDEPNSNIDPKRRKILAEAIRNKRKHENSNFLITSHITDELIHISNNILTIENLKVKYYSESKNKVSFIISVDTPETIIKQLSNEYYTLTADKKIIAKNRNISGISQDFAEFEDKIENISKIPPTLVDYYEGKN